MERRRNWFFILTGLDITMSCLVTVINSELYRNAIVSDVFVEANSSGQLEFGEAGSGKLRLVEIISNKIFCISRPEQTLESLQVQSRIILPAANFLIMFRSEELRATD